MTKALLILILTMLLACGHEETARVEVPEHLSFMTFNVLVGTSYESSLKTIEQSGADIIGLQEASAERLVYLASQLGYYSASFSKNPSNASSNDTGILSKYPIQEYYEGGVLIKLSEELKVAVFSVHLVPYPYEPYDFRDGKITSAPEAIASSETNRLPQMDGVLDQIDQLIGEGVPVFLTGDFNEPSHLDWNNEAADNGKNFGQVVNWPVSSAIVSVGMVDTYRQSHPDVLDTPGITWTTDESENEVYDRIDLIYHSPSDGFLLETTSLIGGPGDQAEIIVPHYESDHYAVMALFKRK